MLRTLSLFLPAIVPSWAFFDVITASPRVEFALSDSMSVPDENWQEFRPRPQSVSVFNMIRRLFWNPKWNENLFVVSCCERLLNHPTAHSEDEIFARIARDLQTKGGTVADTFLSYRITLVSRENDQLVREPVYVSSKRQLCDAP